MKKQNKYKYDLSIVVVGHDHLEELRILFQSIKNYSWDINFEIILVENASQDGTFSVISK